MTYGQLIKTNLIWEAGISNSKRKRNASQNATDKTVESRTIWRLLAKNLGTAAEL